MCCFCQPWEKINYGEYALSDFSALIKFYLVLPSLSLISTTPQPLQNLTRVLFFCSSQPWELGALCAVVALCVSRGSPHPKLTVY